jgi:hypothetical protein
LDVHKASKVVTNPWISAGATIASSWLRLFPGTQENKHPADLLPWAQEHATALLCDGRSHGPTRTSAPFARRTTSVLGPLLTPTSRLGEIVPLGDSQMERLRKNILLGVIEAIALRGTIEGLFEKRITVLADLPQGGIKGVWRYWSRKDQTPIDKGYRFLCRR